MDFTDEFDRALAALGRSAPGDMTGAMAHVHDTLRMAVVSSRVLFGEKWTPDAALAIYDRMQAE